MNKQYLVFFKETPLVYAFRLVYAKDFDEAMNKVLDKFPNAFDFQNCTIE